jgi:hypothetical protein
MPSHSHAPITLQPQWLISLLSQFVHDLGCPRRYSGEVVLFLGGNRFRRQTSTRLFLHASQPAEKEKKKENNRGGPLILSSDIWCTLVDDD